MSNVNTLSFSRSCLYTHIKGRNLPFRGSSLTRIKPNPKAIQNTTETPQILDKTPNTLEVLQDTADSLYECERDTLRDENQTNENSTSRTFSSRTRKKVRDKALAFIHTIRDDGQTVKFLTLTFINQTTDEQAHKILNKFLTTLRKHHPNLSYLWVAERQEGSKNKFGFGTGNIHYHMLINVYLDISYFNALWCICQYNAGIKNPNADLATAKQSTTIQQLFAACKFKEIQKYLNPLDIDVVRNMKGCATYLTKYITKNEGSFNSAVWHCSRSVSRLATAQLVDRSTHELLLDSTYNGYVNKHGVLIQPKEFETKDSNGKIIAKTVFIQQVDKVHAELLHELTAINRFLLDLDYKKIPKNINTNLLYDFDLPHYSFTQN